MIEPYYYHQLRAAFTPDPVRLVLLFESPPVSGRYFYDPDDSAAEVLYLAVMKLFGWTPATKREGLELLQSAGVVLLDATYQQVDKMTRVQRREIMRGEYADLVARLPDAPILIGMAGVLDAVGRALINDGFDVLNRGRRIPFPAMGHQPKFHELAREAIRQTGLVTL